MEKVQSKTDEELVLETRTSNKEIYAELVDRYSDKLLRYAQYLIHDDQKALDIVQESFIKAYINLNGFNTKKKFSSWIYRIVHNVAMNEVKKHRREIPIAEGIDFRSDLNVEESYNKEEIRREAHHCLKSLPLMYSEPLALFFLEEKSYQEISDILHIPMGTVATRINRAKALMKKVCQKNK